MDTKKKKIAAGIVILFVLGAIGALVFLFLPRQAEKPKAEDEKIETIIPQPPAAQLPPHPGTIIVRDRGNKVTREAPAEAAPIEERYVFYKEGKEVPYGGDYDKVIPIIEVEITPRDKKGVIVAFPAVQADKIEIKSYGPDKKLLRTAVTDLTVTTPDPVTTPPK